MKKSLLALALLSTFTAPVFAVDMYGSVVLGGSSVADDGSGLTPSGTGYSLLFGAKVNRNFSAEAGYTSLLSDANVGSSPGVSASMTVNGFEVAGIGSYPINEQFSVFGRLGYASMSGTIKMNAFGLTFTSPSASFSGLVYGPGVEYNVNKQIGIRVGYNIYNLTGSDGNLIVNQPYASVSYSF